ncbi:MAG: hypothetical protein HQL53_04180 [Magnetococcales bacterium]|nr:hypothetical protein [Magnetococcales bacterium]
MATLSLLPPLPRTVHELTPSTTGETDMIVFRSMGDVLRARRLLTGDAYGIVTREVHDLIDSHANLPGGIDPETGGFVSLLDSEREPTAEELLAIGIHQPLTDTYAITVETATAEGSFIIATSEFSQECTATFLIPQEAAWLPQWLIEAIGDALEIPDTGTQRGEINDRDHM